MSRLPEQFSDLEIFVDQWALSSAALRAEKRSHSSLADKQAYYEIMLPKLPEILAFLDTKPLADHNEKERALMLMALSFAHVAQAVEVQKADEPKHQPMRDAMRLTQSSADYQPQ